jgi:hypothetical protein
MRIFEVQPKLYQSSAYEETDVKILSDLGINCVIDLEGGFDLKFAGLKSYLYWPFIDWPFMPDKRGLFSVATFGYAHWKTMFDTILVHCSQGNNRSGLVLGLMLVMDGVSGKEAVELIRSKNPAALFNVVFAHFLKSYI